MADDPRHQSTRPDWLIVDELAPINGSAWAAAMLAAMTPHASVSRAALPPPKKRKNPKREAQAAQRKARAINRRAGK